MHNITDWLVEYGNSHQHPRNKLLHWLCVPPIVLSVLGFFMLLPVPVAIAQALPGFNWVQLVVALAVVYYWLLSPALAIGLVPVIALTLAILLALQRLPWSLGISCAVIFVIGWIGQFVGHAIEGRRPSFFKDLQFLLIGPLWLLASVYRSLNINYVRR